MRLLAHIDRPAADRAWLMIAARHNSAASTMNASPDRQRPENGPIKLDRQTDTQPGGQRDAASMLSTVDGVDRLSITTRARPAVSQTTRVTTKGRPTTTLYILRWICSNPMIHGTSAFTLVT